MTNIRYEQAVYGSFPFWDRGYDMLGHSPGCRPEWLADFRRACQRYGEPTRDASPTGSLFALRLPSGPWAIVGVSAPGVDDRGRPGALAFHGLFVTPREYRKTGFHPFLFARALREDWAAGTGQLPAGTISAPSSDASTDSDDAIAIRAAALVAAGRRIAIASADPISRLAAAIWTRLPVHVRRRASVATLAFSDGNGFDVLGVPKSTVISLDPRYVAFDPSVPAPDCPTPARRVHWRRWLAGVCCVVVIGLARVQFARPANDRSRARDTAPGEPLAAPDRKSYPAVAVEPDVRARVSDGLIDVLERFGVDAADVLPVDAQPALLMTRFSDRLRYRGPLLTPAEVARLRTAPDGERVLAWHAHIAHFLPDRPLPRGFADGPLRWQLDAFLWSYHLSPDPTLSLAEIPDALGDALAIDPALRPLAAAGRDPTLDAYAGFLGALPRR
jgi:hypothetical protein